MMKDLFSLKLPAVSPSLLAAEQDRLAAEFCPLALFSLTSI